MPLPTRVAHEQVGPPVAVVVALGDPHAGVRVDKAGAAGLIDEAEPKATRRQIDVVAVRVLVVRDVEVEPPVAVQVGEHGAERVVVRRRVDPGLPSDLAEAGAPGGAVALVQEEQVAHPEMVRRISRHRAGYRGVRFGVPRDEDVRAAVAVHVPDRDAGVPAEGDDAGRACALRERSVAVVPEDLVVRSRRDVEVGVVVAVQVRRDAALPADGEARARLRCHVDEMPVVVAEELAVRQRATPEVGVGVAVDDEQVDPAVVVVVEPANAPAHHRRRVRADAVAERALAEIEPDLPRHVLQPDAREPHRSLVAHRGALLRRRQRRERPAAPDVGDEPAAAVLLQLERLLERGGGVTAHDRRGHVLVGRQLARPVEGDDGDRRPLPVPRLEPDAHPLELRRGDIDRGSGRRADLPCQLGELVAGRRAGEIVRPPVRERRRLEAEVGDEIARDPPRCAPVEHRLDAA